MKVRALLVLTVSVVALAPVETRAAAPTGPLIRLDPAALVLVDAGGVVRDLPLPLGGPFDLRRLARTGGPQWLAEASPGVFELHAPLVVSPGAELVIAGELRLGPGTSLVGRHARLRLDGARVVSWDPATGAPLAPGPGRPYVLVEGGRLDVAGSELGHLGSTDPGHSGVTWRQGASGVVERSRFHHNHVGAETSRAADIAITDTTFADNTGVGADLDAETVRVAVVHATTNGGNGIVVSGAGLGTALAGNEVRGNGGHGLVVRRSRGLRVQENVVEGNAGDGIVIDSTSEAAVVANVVDNHRVGLRLSGGGSGHELRDNRLVAIGVGVEVQTAHTTLAGNRVERSREAGILIEATGTLVSGGSVEGAGKGLDLRSSATVTGLRVESAQVGVIARPGTQATLDRVRIDASDTGLRTLAGARVVVSRSRITAPKPQWGEPARSSHTDFVSTRHRSGWPVVVALSILALAVGTEMLRARRSRPRPRSHWNAGAAGARP